MVITHYRDSIHNHEYHSFYCHDIIIYTMAQPCLTALEYYIDIDEVIHTITIIHIIHKIIIPVEFTIKGNTGEPSCHKLYCHASIKLAC